MKKSVFLLGLIFISFFSWSQREIEYKVAVFSPNFSGDNVVSVDSVYAGSALVETVVSTFILGDAIKGDGSMSGGAGAMDIVYQIKTDATGGKTFLGISMQLLVGGSFFYFSNIVPNRMEQKENILWCFKNNGEVAKFEVIEDYNMKIYKPLEVLRKMYGGEVLFKFSY